MNGSLAYKLNKHADFEAVSKEDWVKLWTADNSELKPKWANLD